MRAKQIVTKLKVLWDAMRSAAFLCTVVVIGGMSGRSSAESTGSGAVKIAVFGFELEDATPAAAYVGKPTTSDESLQKATVAAREQLAGSGRLVIDSQAANFAGGEEGWASGVRMLIKHQVLVQ
jgi:hypothetical protein